MFRFKETKKNRNNRARKGIIETPRGKIETPCFVPVATKGAIKGASFEKINDFGADVFMINTFHFFCNQKYKQVSRFNGLHCFLGIEYPLMTDSGGFQVFSLGSGWEQGIGKVATIKNNISFLSSKKTNNVKITEKGVIFKSPYNGDRIEMTPEISIKVQEKLGADIIFAFDECTSPFDSYKYHQESLERTHRWAERSLGVFKNKNQEMFGIVQGGKYEDLRKKSAQFIGSLPFFGFGIGGSFGESFGDSKSGVFQVLDWIIPFLPDSKPRHLLGIGEPDDILEAVQRGVDSFDCVVPTRWARHGTAMTWEGRVNLKSAKFSKTKKPIDKNCFCPVCLNYSSSYISHLLKEKEIYGIMLLTEHNLYWILNFMKEIRESIKNDSFESFKKSFLRQYKR
jgi:queuine tRNA-ribosyltransferase